MRTVLFFVSFLTVATVSSRGQTPRSIGRVTTRQQVFPKATHPAEFPGGSDELGKYLARHLKYPSSLLKSGIYPPPITVSFVVAETGAVENVEVIELRQEDQVRLEAYLVKVISTLEKMPRWKPATTGNIAVASRHIIPVSIDIK